MQSILSEENPYINTVRKDPKHFLKKARYFYNSAKLNKDDNIEDDENDYEYIKIRPETEDYNDYEYVKIRPVTEDYNDYEYVKVQPKETSPVIEKPPPTYSRVKHGYGRYYDPIRKHYYKTSDVLEAIPAEKVKPADVWFPENPLSYKTIFDKNTGQYFKIDKVYNDDGTYKIVYKKLQYAPVKRPGTDYYKPNYET